MSRMIGGEGSLVLLSGKSHPELSKQIAQRVGQRLGDCFVNTRSSLETYVGINESLRGKHVYIIQTGTKEVNQNVMELLIMIYACKTSSASTINVVMPYMPYSRQCRMRKRSAIPAKLVANMLQSAGATRLITMDLYRKEIQGFFDIPVENLRASTFFLHYIREHIADYRNAVIVARNPSNMSKATSYADRLRLSVAVVHGEDRPCEEDDEMPPSPSVGRRPRTECQTDNLASVIVPARVIESVPAMMPKEKPPLTLVGDVSGKIAIIVDDLIDDPQSFVSAAEVLKDRGAYKVYVFATHGLLSANAPETLDDSVIDEVVVTNTVPHDLQKMQCHKIKTVDVSLMFCEAIRRTFFKESMSHLFKGHGMHD